MDEQSKLEQHTITDSQIQQRIQQLNLKDSTDKPWHNVCTQIFTIEFYKEYFDVTTQLVQRRLLNSFNPFIGNFFEIGDGIPDLYGPFWILNTLIFTIAFSANLTKYLQLKPGEPFEYQFSFVPLAALILYGRTLIIPLIYRVALKCFQQDKLTYLHCLFIYGYSATVTIPVSLLSCIPHPAIQWMLLLYGLFSETAFLATNFNNELKYIPTERKYIIVTTVAIVQIAMMIVYKFYFFRTENYEQLGLVSNDNIVSNDFNKHLHNHY